MEALNQFAGATTIFFVCATVGVSFGAMFNPRLRALGDTRGAMPLLGVIWGISLGVAVAFALGRIAIVHAGPPAWLMWWHLMAAAPVVGAIVAAILPRPSKSKPSGN